MGEQYRLNIIIDASNNVSAEVAGVVASLEQIDRKLESLDRMEAHLKIMADAAQFDREMEKAEAKTRQMDGREATVKMNADTRGFDADVRKISNQVENINRMRAEAKATLKGDEFEQEMRKLDRLADQLDRRVLRMAVEVNSSEAIAELAALRTALAVTSRSADAASGGFRGFANRMANLRFQFRALRTAGIALAGMMVPQLVSSIAPVAFGLATLAAGGAEVAGGFGLIAGAIRPVLVSLERQKDLQDAVKERQDDVTDAMDAYRDAVRDSGKDSNEAARALRELEAAQTRLRQTTNQLEREQSRWDGQLTKLQNNLRELGRTQEREFRGATTETLRFGNELTKLAERAMPALGREARETVDAIVKAFNGLRNSMSGRERGSFEGMLENISKVMGQLTTVAGKFGMALANIFGDAQPSVNKFLGSLEDLADKFLAWTRSAQGQRQINQLFENAGKIASAVKDAFEEVADALVDVGAKKNSVDQLARTIRDLGDFVASAIRFFGRLNDILDAAGRILNNLNRWWSAAGRAIHEFISEGRIGERTMNALNRGAEGFVDGLRELGRSLGLTKDNFKEWANWAKNAVEDVRDWFNKLPGWLKNAVNDAVDAVLGPFDELYKTLVGNSIVPDMVRDITDEFTKLEKDSDNIFSRMAKNVGGIFKNLGRDSGRESQSLWRTVTNWFDRTDKDGSKSIDTLRKNSTADMDKARRDMSTDASTTNREVVRHFNEMKAKGIPPIEELSMKSVRNLEEFAQGAKENGEKAKADFEPPVSDMSVNGQMYMSNLLWGMQQVNERGDLGLDPIQEFTPKQHDAQNNKRFGARYAQAEGGVLESGIHYMDSGGQLGVGGVTGSRQPRVVYGEGPARKEIYMVVDHPDPEVMRKQHYYLQDAANELGYALLPKNVQGFEQGGFWDESRNWTSYVANIVHEVESKFATRANTYATHPGGESNSADFWSPGGRGSPIAQSVGNSIKGYLDHEWPGYDWLIWNGMYYSGGGSQPFPSDPHYDHVHSTYQSQGGGGGGGVTDIQPYIDQYLPKPWQAGDNGIYNLADKEGAATKMYDKAVEYLLEHAPVYPDATGAGAAVKGELRDWIKSGLGFSNVADPSDSNISTMAGRAMQESGGNPNAVNNWDSNAAAGTPSKGLFQIIEPTWGSYRNSPGPDAGSFDSNWDDPVMSTAVAARYMMGRYGHLVGANGSGYTEGGLALKPHQAWVAEHGPELFLPLHDRDAMRRFVDQLGDWHQQRERGAHENKAAEVSKRQHDIDAHSGSVRRDPRGEDRREERMERELRRLGDRLERTMNRRVEATIRNIDDLARAMVDGAFAANESDVGRRIAERHASRAFKKALMRRGK